MTQHSIETIAEIARSVPKRGDKAQAFNALRRIIENASERPESDLARLYAFFLPPAPSTPKTAFAWAAKAAAKNDVRHYLNFVHVTETIIEATDGHRLHIAPNAYGLEPGYYGPEGVRLHAPEWSRFPDTVRVRPNPDAPGRRWHSLAVDAIPVKSKPLNGGKLLHWYELPAGGDDGATTHINKQYLDHLVSMNKAEAIHYNTGHPADSVLVKLEGDRLAVLMPLRH